MSLFRDLRESAREEARKAEQSATARIPMEVAKALAAGGALDKGPGSGGEARAFRDAPVPVEYPQEPPPVHRHTTAPVVSASANLPVPQPTGNPRRASPA